MPAVSVVTPFYNTAAYLEECIRSVLAQSFTDFEYVLVDNASTDGSLEIAQSWAERDPRIRVVHYDELLPQIPNYNRALRLADPGTRYCKMVQADDALMPRCLEEMVALADSNSDIGLVGAYTILQNRVFLDGLDYSERVIDGDELCRRYLMDGTYIFGHPTTQLYRAVDVRAREAFFSNDSVIADTDTAVRLVRGRKFAFVHQVLSFTRRENDSISRAHKGFDIDVLTRRILLERHGRDVLEPAVFRRRQRLLARRHARALGQGLLGRQTEAFWTLHRRGLAEVGLRLRRRDVAFGALVVLLRALFNLEGVARGALARLRG